jgi:signal transduction histidine kinase
MDLTVPASAAELSAAVFQAVITGGLTVLCLVLYRRYGKIYLGVWALAWGVYTVRMGAILTFLITQNPLWLFWHQVTTGWTALALLLAAWVFAYTPRWRWGYAAIGLFPLAWSYVAIYRLDSFFLAAWPAVLFLSVASFFTGWTFLAHYRRLGSGAAGLLSVVFLFWGIHHLNYPLLRARGIWNPWGYYLDVIFSLLVGTGLLLLVLDDLARGVQTLSTLSGDLQSGGDPEVAAEQLVKRPMTLPAVSGSALYLHGHDGSPQRVAAAGVCTSWSADSETASLRCVERVRESGMLEIVREPEVLGDETGFDHPYVAALPLRGEHDVIGSMLVVGSARDPFAALDDQFLVALGQHVGAALQNADLTRRLKIRSTDLERLAAAMVRQHEDERARLSRELHDETAQVLAALNFQLAAMQNGCPAPLAEGLGRAQELLREGIRSIRSVTEDLRPPLLDELGLVRSLKALVDDFREQSGLNIEFDSTERVPELPPEGEVALFRALQEGLANAARHSGAETIHVALDVGAGRAELRVRDDGIGLDDGPNPIRNAERRGGLWGMHQRITALGGHLALEASPDGGASLTVRVPTEPGDNS